MRTFLGFLLAFCLAGCSSIGLDKDINTHISPAGKGIHYTDARLNRLEQPIIRVQPKDPSRMPPTALLLAPRLLQTMDNGSYVAAEVGRILWQVFLEEEVFPILEYSEQTVWRHRSQALGRARVRGADLALGVEITHLLAGGTMSESALSLRLYIYETGSGMLLWSMEHSGSMENGLAQDYIFYEDRTRMPSEPIYAIASALSRDMAIPLKAWAHHEQGESVDGQLDEMIEQRLF